MNISLTQELKPFLNTTVGFIKINNSWVHHNNSYECAAWWEDSKIETGVYPLTLVENYYAPKNLKLQSKISAVVVDDYFPALWGGVAISNKPYVAKNIGQSRTITKDFEILDAIKKTGNSPGNEVDICLNPMLWQAFIDAARENLNSYHQLYQQYHDEYLKFGDSKHDVNLSMIAHAGERMAELARGISEIKRCMDYYQNNYYCNLYTQNTSWINLAA